MRMSSLSGDESAALFRFGEFTLDCRSHMLLRNSEEQHLSPKAQQLLRMLILKRPSAVSRQEIYDALWPETFVSETNMASIVSELRRTLGDDARSAQYIRTVHGFGYAFAGDVQTSDSAPIPVAAAILRCGGQRHVLYEGENLVGRSPDCHVVLNEPTVSRHHAVILISGDDIAVEDRGSRNGTHLNGKKISRARIHRNDTISFGVIQATITKGISSTLPLPMFIDRSRRHSSGSFTTA
jgi:DNA-binding winged helix-turn-helix (wHTH) protein